MSRHTKKPITIEAVQYAMNEYADAPGTFREDPPEWLRQAADDKVLRFEFRGEDYWYAVVDTLEGPMTVNPGDWIIRGVNGELYPCKPDIFAKSYDPAVED